MNILILKLIMAPLMISLASLAGRRWGSAISGWIVGLPLTSGPVIFIITLSHDRTFAFDAVRGVLSGGFSLVAYALVYAWASRRFNWFISLAGSILVFGGMTMSLQNLSLPFLPLFFSIFVTILIGLWLMPSQENIETVSVPGKWDIPARMLIGTSFILLVTGIAPYIGSRLTGLLTTVPLYISILTAFAHRHQGSAGAVSVLRGLVYGMFAFATFYLVLGWLIQNTALTVSFGAAIVVTLIVQGVTLLILQKTPASL